MRPQKLSSEQMLRACALQFKAHGYAGTSMDMLAKACGLSKASFYYYFSSKEALLLEVLEYTQNSLNRTVFNVSATQSESAVVQFQQMHQKAVQFFSAEVAGCLMGIISLEVSTISTDVSEKIRQIFQDWQQAFFQIFVKVFDLTVADQLAKMSIADYEGAILMYRLTQDTAYLDYQAERIIRQLESA